MLKLKFATKAENMKVYSGHGPSRWAHSFTTLVVSSFCGSNLNGSNSIGSETFGYPSTPLESKNTDN